MPYTVIYTDPEATYPAPEQMVTLNVSSEKIWEEALKLGMVMRIYNNVTGNTVFSINWSFNFLGLTETQINKNFEY